jgi:hypothetical protein
VVVFGFEGLAKLMHEEFHLPIFPPALVNRTIQIAPRESYPHRPLAS